MSSPIQTNTLAVLAACEAEVALRRLAVSTVGPPPTTPAGLVSRQYLVANRNAGSLSPTAVGVLISSSLSPYADRSYVDTRDLLNATKDQIDAADALKLKRSTRNVVNGVAGLDAGGRIESGRIPLTAAQRYPRGPYTPVAYNGGSATNTAETTLFTHTVADPGIPYRLLVHGQIDVRTTGGVASSPLIQVRLGSAAGAPVASGFGHPVQYRYGLETFNREAPALGSGWEQVYTGPGGGHAETNGARAFWVRDGTDPTRTGVFRKINDFATTVDDYQRVSCRIFNTAESDPGPFGAPARNRIFGRMDVARTSYVTFDFTNSEVSLIYASGGAEQSVPNTTVSYNQAPNDEFVAEFGLYSLTNRRRFRFSRNNTVLIDWTDSGNVTAMGADFRGWGFGMRAGRLVGLFGPTNQTRPAEVDQIGLSDPLAVWNADPEAYTTAVLLGVPLSSQPSLTGTTTLHVTLKPATPTAGLTVLATAVRPRLHVMAIPA